MSHPENDKIIDDQIDAMDGEDFGADEAQEIEKPTADADIHKHYGVRISDFVAL